MARPSLREHLLAAGDTLVWSQGYAGTGVRDVVAAAGARAGSFTNHFASKEDFIVEVLERYFAYVRGLVAEALRDDGLAPVQRLRRYLDAITVRLEQAEFARGCMIGNLSLEASPASERLRLRLAAIFGEWRKPFAACIAEAQAAGALATDLPAEELADFLLMGWQGAMMRMKLERTAEPLERFKTVLFATVFKDLKA